MEPEGKFTAKKVFQKGDEPCRRVYQEGVIVKSEVLYLEASV